MIVRGDGVDLSVQARGDAANPTLLLVHGYPDSQAVWDGVAGHLADRFHVVTYDVRGAGRSDHPAAREDYRFEHLMADMRAVLDEVSPAAPVHLAGHDWGSIQCWEAVTTMPERFASFTSISGPCLDQVAHWNRAHALRPAGLRQALRSWYIGFFQLPALPELAWRAGAARALRLRTTTADAIAGVNLYRANMSQRLSKPGDRRTSVPTQVVVPTKDAYVTPALAREAPAPWTDRLWVREVPGRHWVVRSRPDVVARLITEHAGRDAAEAPPDPEPAGEFGGKRVVVTGAGSGIGRAIALAFAELGAEIVAVDLDEAAATRTAELAALLAPPPCGPRSRAYQVDVSDPDAMAKLAATVRREHGVPDVVVNNAGIGMVGDFLAHSATDWDAIVGVNLRGVVHGARLFAAQMIERGEGGQIVNTASAAAYIPSANLSAYATTKAAVVMLSECLSAELRRHGIGVHVICPGVVNTPIVRATRFLGLSDRDQDDRRAAAARSYARRNYGPEKVAAAVVKAVRRGQVVVPVSPEAKVGRALSRISPAAMRAFARVRL